MVTLTTVEQSLLLCSPGYLGALNVTGKLVAFIFPIVTTANPNLGKCETVLLSQGKSLAKVSICGGPESEKTVVLKCFF